MKYLAIFVIVCICIANCEEFGQRIPKNITKTNSTKKESTNKAKDLDTHDTVRTYEYALAPFEVQSHQPKVIAEEHTLHELPALGSALGPALGPAVAQAVHTNEPIILKDTSDDYSPQSQALYGAQHMPKHYGSHLPIYRDDPKEHLKGYLPLPLEPALPMHAFSQTKHELNHEVTAHSKPVAYASPLPTPYVPPIEHKQYVDYEPHNGLARYDGPVRHGAHSQYATHDSYLDDSIAGIPGHPWKNYPIFHTIPYTNFKCLHPGYYADVEAGCQVWHFCQLDGRHDRFLCSNGTVFNQKARVCDWWYNVDCPSSVLKYGINADLYRVPHHNYMPSHKPSHNPYELPLDELRGRQHYQRLEGHDLQHSGHGLLYASESQTVPKKLAIRRVHRIRTNKSNSTDSGLLSKKSVKK